MSARNPWLYGHAALSLVFPSPGLAGWVGWLGCPPGETWKSSVPCPSAGKQQQTRNLLARCPRFDQSVRDGRWTPLVMRDGMRGVLVEAGRLVDRLGDRR
jgi:hypothetical protein